MTEQNKEQDNEFKLLLLSIILLGVMVILLSVTFLA